MTALIETKSDLHAGDGIGGAPRNAGAAVQSERHLFADAHLDPRRQRLLIFERRADCLSISIAEMAAHPLAELHRRADLPREAIVEMEAGRTARDGVRDRKSTRLNSSHMSISYAVFCLKK